MPVVDNAIYSSGVRVAHPVTLEDTYRALEGSGGFAWIGLYRPKEAEMRSVASEFGIHPLAVEDTITAHQRPKLERYGDVLFTVLRPARYLDAEEEVEFGEVHIFSGPDFVVTVRHAESPDLAAVRHRMECDPELLALGPEAVLYAVLDQVVDEYFPVLAGLQHDIDEIEDQVFGGDPEVSRRIYELLREVIGLQRATTPLLGALAQLQAGFEKYHTDQELQRYLRDVRDHTVRVVERTEGFRVLLQNMLTVNATLVGQRQNDEMQRMTEASLSQGEEVKRISAWAAILFAPSLVGGIYGMNFVDMPGLDSRFGFPLSIVGMLAVSVVLWLVFRRRGWL
ncbi:magnesium and cobalt transport protein CorA [Nakamurella leprariae]|uniref:Magnesium and cobalt transport protein CorA n=1 Tax=Nakamurella leprariae TaxID=2803911 RepID=A0A939BYC4_9ACTN|nr:magnesium and cobalt transport protein CorA [Nakamurella leprariae]MBM9469403.1 magnesium and cobalt transport protein CorA [Nakamurella leprariae]